MCDDQEIGGKGPVENLRDWAKEHHQSNSKLQIFLRVLNLFCCGLQKSNAAAERCISVMGVTFDYGRRLLEQAVEMSDLQGASGWGSELCALKMEADGSTAQAFTGTRDGRYQKIPGLSSRSW